jgi:hypothetical protein
VLGNYRETKKKKKKESLLPQVERFIIYLLASAFHQAFIFDL